MLSYYKQLCNEHRKESITNGKKLMCETSNHFIDYYDNGNKKIEYWADKKCSFKKYQIEYHENDSIKNIFYNDFLGYSPRYTVEYNEFGIIVYEKFITEDNLKDIYVEYCIINGVIRYIEDYGYNKSNGKILKYYINGNLLSDYNHKGCKTYGLCINYYKSGNIGKKLYDQSFEKSYYKNRYDATFYKNKKIFFY